MASSVFFKFKSQKEPTRVEFDGTGISVFELKREIIVKSGLGDGTDFDLHIYTDDNSEGKFRRAGRTEGHRKINESLTQISRQNTTMTPPSFPDQRPSLLGVSRLRNLAPVERRDMYLGKCQYLPRMPEEKSNYTKRLPQNRV